MVRFGFIFVLQPTGAMEAAHRKPVEVVFNVKVLSEMHANVCYKRL
jgi:hypothetical protein